MQHPAARKQQSFHDTAINISTSIRFIVLIALIALMMTGCQTSAPTESNVSGASDETGDSGESLALESQKRTPYNGAEVLPGQLIPDEIALRLMYDLSHGDDATMMAAVQSLLTSQDERFVPVLIEMLRFGQIGIVPFGPELVDALNQLSGASFGADWPAWIEWYGATDLVPPPGFTGWKGDVLAKIDPGFADFLQDEFPSDIRVEEIQWGGVRVDGIPALDQPTMLTVAGATFLADEEPVFGISINGESHAYPLRILDWHEMANDTVGGVPVSLAYCTLCGAAIAYDGRASNGEVYDFGSSGFLFRSNKLMYDRQTRTLWNQLTGEPVLGPLAGSGVRMDLLPVVLTTWQEWRTQHPDTMVVDIDTGYRRPYELGAAYGDYFSSTETMFPVWQRDDLLATKDQIYALRIDEQPVAYPIEILVEEGVVNDTVGETNLVLVAPSDPVTAWGTTRNGRPVGYIVGSEVRAFNRGEFQFSPGPSADVVVDEQGNAWQVTEEALVGPDGLTSPRINGHLAYWFGWFSFFPNTLVYGVDLPGTS